MGNREFLEYIKVLDGAYIGDKIYLLDKLNDCEVDIKPIYLRLKEMGYGIEHNINFIEQFNMLDKEEHKDNEVFDIVMDTVRVESKFLVSNKELAIEHFGYYIYNGIKISDMTYSLVVHNLKPTSRVYLNGRKEILVKSLKSPKLGNGVLVRDKLKNKTINLSLRNYFNLKYVDIDIDYLGIGINGKDWEWITDINIGGIYDHVLYWS